MPWLAVLEFMPYGDLKGLVKTAGEKGVKLSPGEALQMCYQAACGCGYINSLVSINDGRSIDNQTCVTTDVG